MGWTEFDNNYNILLDYLDDKEQYALKVATDAFGYKEETVDLVIYAMFGYQTLRQYVNDCLAGNV